MVAVVVVVVVVNVNVVVVVVVVVAVVVVNDRLLILFSEESYINKVIIFSLFVNVNTDRWALNIRTMANEKSFCFS